MQRHIFDTVRPCRNPDCVIAGLNAKRPTRRVGRVERRGAVRGADVGHSENCEGVVRREGVPLKAGTMCLGSQRAWRVFVEEKNVNFF